MLCELYVEHIQLSVHSSISNFYYVAYCHIQVLYFNIVEFFILF